MQLQPDNIKQINDFIQTKLWFDFEVMDWMNGNLTIVGSTDFSYFHELEINFIDVFFIQCLNRWKSDTKKKVFYVPDLEEQRKINLKYQIEQGNLLLKFEAEDIGAIYISCKNVDYKIEKVLY